MRYMGMSLAVAIGLFSGLATTQGLAEQAFIDEEIRLPRIELVDSRWQAQDLSGELTRGKIIVITFSYTTCGSICPLGNDVMAAVDDALQDMRTERPVLLLTVTFDPQHDTPDVMAEAAEKFGASDRWMWLTGSPGDIRRMLEAFDADVTDIVTHDPFFAVGDPETGRFVRSLSMPGPDELIEAVWDFAG